uniref:SET domain-containing protein n=1 Tax=Magallana gigas TaxID=29159 RepID=A0A8W8MI49_MAGGI
MISIDATNTERKGKYIKEEEVGSPLNNCVMRLLVTENYPRLCLFANRDIKAGEELRYDYGEANLPWLQDSEENNEETIDTETESEKEVDDDSNTASPMEVPCKSKKLSTERSSCPPHAKPEAQGQELRQLLLSQCSTSHMDCCRKASLERQFNNFIKLGKTPGQLDCLNAIRKEKALSGFTWMCM